MAQLRVAFQGSFAFDDVREAIGDALTALGDAPAPWEQVSRVALDDRNYAGLAFEGTWRRGEATLSMSASTDASSGNPRDGYGYDTVVALASPRLAFRCSGGSSDGLLSGLYITLPVEPETFRRFRAALAAKLGHDATDQSWNAVANVEALDSVDRALQEELLRAALKCDGPSDHARAELMKWSERLLGAGLGERLRACPADLDAWTRCLASPPDGFTRERLTRGCARLAPWNPVDPQHPLAPAWRWLPALGGDGRAPEGWRQLDDGQNPTWERAGFASRLARSLLGLDGAGEVPLGHRRLADGTRGGATARAAWTSAELPKAHVSWSQRPAKGFDTLATVDWLWGDGADDVVVLAARRRPSPSPMAMFVSGSEAFRAAAMRALHALEPFAWRPVARPMQRPFARARPRAKGTRREVRSLLTALTEASTAVRDAFAACQCAATDPSPCAHERVVMEAKRDAWQRRNSTQTSPRDVRRFDALQHAYDAAATVRTKPAGAASALDRAWLVLSIANAVVDAPP